MRLNLARALVARADLLLLDEPTNHLDLDAVLWLESWLKSFPGTLVMISHDRDFLDAVVNQILHIDAGQMKLYSGNYSTFERTRAERLALQQAMHDKQQREVAHLHAYVERFRAKASKARQAQSRMKALARMEMISAAHVDTPFSFRFRESEGVSDPLLTLEDVAIGYGETALLDKIRSRCAPAAASACWAATAPASPRWSSCWPAKSRRWRDGDLKAATSRSAISPSTRWNCCARTSRRSSTWCARNR